MLISIMLMGCAESETNIEDFPEETITLIVPWDAGGAGPDAMAKTIESYLSKEKDIDIVVDNLPGGGSATGMTELVNSEADGYTIGLASSSILSLMATEQVPLSLEDFTTISFVGEDPYLLIKSKDASWDDLDDFMDDVENGSGKMKIGTAGLNNVPHALAELTGDVVGKEIEHISFDGAPRAITEVMGGHIDAAVVKPSDGMSQLQSEDVLPLAVYSKERLDLMSDTPTFEENGYNLFDEGEIAQISYLVGPADLDPEIRDTLNELFNEAVMSDDFQELAEDLVFTTHDTSTEELDKEVNDVYESLADLAPKVFSE